MAQQKKKLGKTILVVEDEIPMLKALSYKFDSEGFKVIEAKDGEEGFALAMRERPDLILLDIIMPKLDGMAMLKKLREHQEGKSVPVIMLTNLSDAKKISEAMLSGVFEFLVKTDWRIDDIVEKVKTKLGLKG